MTNHILALAASLALALPASAAIPAEWPAGAVVAPVVERTATTLVVTMEIHPDAFPTKYDRESWLEPAIVAGSDTLRLTPVVVAGRSRYYQHKRVGGLPADAVMLRAGAKEAYAYSATVPYSSWMDVSSLIITGRVAGCCGDALAALPEMPLQSMDYRPKVLEPVLVYVAPAREEVKTRAVVGQAYIDFPVSKTDILPDYRRNAEELAKIRSIIGDVRNDKDVTINSVNFKGYASPEGPYVLNERLAKGRTEALIEYVRKLYDFPSALMHASWVAEDWDGLRERIEGMELPDKAAILGVIDNPDLTPDMRDARLKKNFPRTYAMLLANVYPALRRSDYKIDYVVRQYTEVAEIASLIGTAPQKLSLCEIFVYAQTLQPASPKFREAMEVAVRLYPDDPVANLNAAVAAISLGDYDSARAYLGKASDSPEAIYAAGVIEARQGNYAAAAPYFERASRGGVKEAQKLLTQMRDWGMLNRQ